jgi:hypothetical protein
VHQHFIDCRKAYDSVRREVLYNILIEFVIPMKLVRLIIMCLTSFNHSFITLRTITLVSQTLYP